MQIQLNGEPKTLPGPMTVANLLENLQIRGDRVAIEVNLEVVRKHRREAYTLKAGDRVEIVSFVGGG